MSRMLYRVIKWLVRFFYPKMEVVGAENLPEEAALIVGNHAQMNGPIACELYFPGRHCTWCAGEMMHLKEVPAYAYRDFWSHKPKAVRWFYKLLSYLIAPLSVCIFNQGTTVPVYHDARLLTTFRETVKRLQAGESVVIFPERDGDYNHILCQFQVRFIDIARVYYKKTGVELAFVPMYIAPELKKMYIGAPIRFCGEHSIQEERQRICTYLMEEITAMACALPEHTVVPYRNIPKREYPSNIPREVSE